MSAIPWKGPNGRRQRLLTLAMCATMIVTTMVVSGYFYVANAGVKLEIENHSGAEVRDLKIKYLDAWVSSADTDIEIPRLPATARVERHLGKIGEGASITLRWETAEGTRHRGCWHLYFNNFYEALRITIPSAGPSELVQEHKGRWASQC